MSYTNLGTQTTVTNFVEKEGVPSDSRVSHYTWQYVNKNGGPDRRFNNNRQFPVMKLIRRSSSTAPLVFGRYCKFRMSKIGVHSDKTW